MFTATRLQAVTYLLGVCLFSIAFLVFLNSSVSFVITTLIKQRTQVGAAVGTLGFADELIALVACPAWGVISDQVGVRTVCALGYAIIGVALLLFVQAKNVFPQLLLARLLFSFGGAATSTMVTAILPSMIAPRDHDGEDVRATAHAASDVHDILPRFPIESSLQESSSSPSPTRLAGIVGLSTGCGALLALGLFLRLPELIQRTGVEPEQSLADSYYIVGLLSLVLSLVCFTGLRHLKGEEGKNWRALVHGRARDLFTCRRKAIASFRSLLESITLGFEDPLLGLGYLGGFVARASSVGISLFIPLFVNAYYISSGACDGAGHSPQDTKEKCRGAFILAAELTGVSQLVALLFAPIFGYLADRYRRFNFPLLLAALVGILGYVGLATLESPAAGGQDGSPWIFVIMALLGISQIGAIVCTLGLLGRCVLGLEDRGPSKDGGNTGGVTSPGGDRPDGNDSTTYQCQNDDGERTENAPLLPARPRSKDYRKGSIAGVYSLAGGIGILILTKFGGLMFDEVSHVAPFYMLAFFNLVLLVTAMILGIRNAWKGHDSPR